MLFRSPSAYDALGNFRTTGARSKLPGSDGLDPRLGVNYEYFTGSDGFAR